MEWLLFLENNIKSYPMILLKLTLLVTQVANNASNAIMISLLATLGFTFFSVVVSSIYKKNFIEPVLIGRMIHNHLKDSPTWLNVFLGAVIHFFTGYIFTEIHLFLYQILTPAWYNGLFLGLANGLIAVVIWYALIKIYKNVLNSQVTEYLVQLLVGHVIFALIVLYMFAPPSLGG